MQYFTTQLRDEQQQTRSLRASHYTKARKFQKAHPHGTPPTDTEVEVEPRHRPTDQSYSSFAAPELAQLRVAGLLPELGEEPPPAPFPHAPAPAPAPASVVAKDQHHGPANVQEEMAKPPSSLYAINATSKTDTLFGHGVGDGQKKKQLNALSTVMHRCLLAGDYARAGRAWGIILRTQVAGGRPVDPRNHGRWGLGAEILLRRPQHPSEPTVSDRFSIESFQHAREYYDRLLVQYPNRKLQPHAVDARTFYPPMFSLWIYEVCEKAKRARPDESAEERTSATEIAHRIDEIIASPPFDRQTTLLHLRANVALWIADLNLSMGNNEPPNENYRKLPLCSTERLYMGLMYTLRHFPV
ncbi:hypothetical protein BDW02DRAFT_642448 [Decorospora gaudefroyi]|uniref:Transcription factor domain-containing protein n=1 Tax=Decorospora gaudefroyi TaxID=184978 RepID=A0A6A5K6E9_9PLEO|nr:hypothetical protein BDW02DRAFT_642448 [Decorospora gaudefroyi]